MNEVAADLAVILHNLAFTSNEFGHLTEKRDTAKSAIPASLVEVHRIIADLCAQGADYATVRKLIGAVGTAHGFMMHIAVAEAGIAMQDWNSAAGGQGGPSIN